MTKVNVRHHAVHPPSAVKHNPAVNPKPNFTPPEKAAVNPNPSMGLDAANARTPAGEMPILNSKRDAESVSNPDSPDYDPDDPDYDSTLDTSK